MKPAQIFCHSQNVLFCAKERKHFAQNVLECLSLRGFIRKCYGKEYKVWDKTGVLVSYTMHISE
jgi:hypothetical protein